MDNFWQFLALWAIFGQFLDNFWTFQYYCARLPQQPYFPHCEGDNDFDDEFSGWDKVQPVQDQGWAAFEDSKPKKPPPRPSKPPPARPPPPTRNKNNLDPKNAPGVVIKAPSTESIKSWNCTTADKLIKSRNSSEIEGIEEIEDDDPFDTSHLDAIIGIFLDITSRPGPFNKIAF